MGLELEFYLGDPETIRKAVEDFDVGKLNDSTIVRGRADMSLHITPHDLDVLSEEFGTASGHEPLELRPSLEVLFDDAERGVFRVADYWVSYAANVPKSQVRSVTERWVATLSKEYEDPGLVVTEAAIQAVESLVALCARAKAEGYAMVHVWFL